MITESVFDPEKAIGNSIGSMEKAEFLQFMNELCRFAAEECPDGSFRGGYRPGNVSYTDGVIAVGAADKACEDGWSKDALEFMAPELFWNGIRSSAADVYSIGLMLFYGLNGGRLPFIPADSADEPTPDDRVNALKSRMNGERISAPEGLDYELTSIIEKSVEFRAVDRFYSPSEMYSALAKYLERTGEIEISPDISEGEAYYDDSDESEEAAEEAEAAETEDIPAEEAEEPVEPEPEAVIPEIDAIMDEFRASEPEIVETSESPEPEAEPEEIPAEDESSEPVEAEEAGSEDETAAPEAEAESEEKPAETEAEPEPEEAPAAEAPKPEPKIIEIEVISRDTPKAPAPKALTEKPRKKKNWLAISAVCLLVLAVIIGISVSSGIRGHMPEIVEKTPPPGESVEPTESVEPSTKPEPVSTYQLFAENLSWQEAEAACVEMGGHLVTINSEAEYEKVCSLLSETYATYVWIGCQRNDSGELVWSTGEKVDFYMWAPGEPSVKDSYDGASENYIMLVKQDDGTWLYNDSRNDPVAKYSKYYGGKIAYVCEITE